MVTTRTKRPAKTAPTDPDGAPDDGVPSFTTAQDEVIYDGPVLMRVDGVDYRMRADRSFTASLVYLRQVRNGSVRDAQFALLDHLAGPAATDKLLQTAELDPEAWNRVLGRALDHVLGRHVEDEEGN